MTRFLRIVAGCILLGVLTVAPVAAQEGGQDDVIQILSVDIGALPVVELVVAIPPSFGDVPADERFFGLTESDERRSISVESLKDTVDVVLVIDTSGSMRGEAMSAAKAAATEFVRQLPPGARIGVIGFGAEPVVASSMGVDGATHEAAISALDATGETALWDALVLAADVLDDARVDQPYVVVLSDGGDTVSNSDQDAASAALQQAGASLYAVALQTAESNESDLVRLVDEVGGEFLRTEQSSELAGLYSEIAGRLTSRYLIRFTAGGTGETSAVLSVVVEDRIAIATTALSLGDASPVATVPAALASAEVPAELGVVIGLEPTLLSKAWILWIGAGAFFVALALVIGQFSLPAVRIRGLGTSTVEAPTRLTGVKDGLSRSAGQLVAHRDKEGKFDLALDSAGMNVRAGEFIVISVALTVTGGLFGSILGGLGGAVGLALLMAVGSFLIVQVRMSRRRAKFSAQLSDTISILIGSLRSGRGMAQALELVSQEAQPPTSTEFRRVVVESRVGRDQVQSLQAVARRMDNPDVEWIAQAIAINRELGGDLVEVLENVSETIRSRTRVQRQVRALSAEGRISGWLMVSMPFIMFAYMRAVNPEYLSPLTSTPVGLAAIGAGLVFIALGTVWIRKLIDLKY